MRATTKVIYGFVITLLGVAFFATFMMVADELYTLALYCGVTCKYPYPWTSPLDMWTAWVHDFSWISISVMLIAFGVSQFVTGILRLRRIEEKF